jgi:hypothetical protein
VVAASTEGALLPRDFDVTSPLQTVKNIMGFCCEYKNSKSSDPQFIMLLFIIFLALGLGCEKVHHQVAIHILKFLYF